LSIVLLIPLPPLLMSDPTPKPEYWVCIIGSTTRDKLPHGADSPMRDAVQDTFKELTGGENENCWSGWGSGKSTIDAIMDVWNKERDDDYRTPSPHTDE